MKGEEFSCIAGIAFAEGCLEQHKAIVAPEHLLPKEEGRHAERAAFGGFREQGVVPRARRRGGEVTLESSFIELQPAGETRDHPVIDHHAIDEDQLLQQPAARHQRALPIRRQAGQREPVGIDPERDGFAERDAVVARPALGVVFAIAPVVLAGERLAAERIAAAAVHERAAGDRLPDEAATVCRLDPLELARGEVGIAAAQPEIEIDGDRSSHQPRISAGCGADPPRPSTSGIADRDRRSWRRPSAPC